ncbi:MAG: glycosyltransferase family 4 protein [Candidatus Margulisiibacteriota bacterium]
MVNSVKKIHFVNMAYDGVTTIHSGVGQCVHNIARAIRLAKNNEVRVALHLLTPNYPKVILAPGIDVLRLSQNICQQSGGEVVFLPYTTAIKNQFGTIEFWREVSEQAASYLEQLSLSISPEDKIIALCHDTAFAGVARMLANKNMGSRLHLDWLPHCTGKLYEGKDFDVDRFDWETDALQYSPTKRMDYRVGVLSDFIEGHLIADFGAPRERLFRFRNGIITEEPNNNDSLIIDEALRKEGIPTRTNLFFSWGRGNHVKGFDIFLETAKHLQEQHGYYPVLLMPPAQEDLAFTDEIVALRRRLALDCSIIQRFDADLPRQILSHPLTKMVALLSRTDVFPTTAMEARLYAHSAILVASRRGGLAEQVKDGEDGYIVPIDTRQECLSAFDRILQDRERWPGVSTQGKKRVLADYNLSRNLGTYLSEIQGEQ